MKYRTILMAALVIVVTGACSSLKKQPARTEGYDIFLLIGQSNMAGRGVMEAGDDAPIDGVWILDGQDRIVPASEPLNQYSTVRKKIGMQRYNLGDSFARSIHKRSGRKILLVVNARGGTTLERWLKGAKPALFNKREGDDPEKVGSPMPGLYDEAVRRTRIAMQYGTLKAILWHQGEGDSSPQKLAVYLERLSGMASDLRKDLGVGNGVPFIAGELNYARKGSDRFNPELRRIGEYIPNGWWVSAEGCGVNPDKTHFSREGLILFGEHYADVVWDKVYKE